MADQDVRKLRGLWTASERVVHVSQAIVILAAQLLVVTSILVATWILYALFVERMTSSLGSIDTLGEVQSAIEHVFAGVLLLMLGLELLKSLTTFFTGFQVQVEIIVVVAMIAVVRHVMLIDLGHTSWTTLIGAAALVLALAISYALVRVRGQSAASPPPRTPDADEANIIN
ncbi:phosphate-starvation-inducible PsiE family protein [Phenylobacterium sp. LjRoot164]|uniref:phosphate-starvation-inducible PsiE family protein n=1 Tax=unclassified Phenylobacterium TaxID=2640670 RepID=UPI003ECF8DD9